MILFLNSIFLLFFLSITASSHSKIRFYSEKIYEVSSLPIKSETKKFSKLNLNQPYKDKWRDKPSVFKTVEDNNNLWKDVIKSRNKVAGYYDTEFANRINYCRYIGKYCSPEERKVPFRKRLEIYGEM